MGRSRVCGVLVAASVLSGLAGCGPQAPGKISGRPGAAGRFAYLIQTKAVGPDGQPGTQVRLARITSGLKPPLFGRPPSPKAEDVKTLMDTATVSSPTQVNKLYASPLNTRLLIHSSEVPINALDENLHFWNMATGGGGVLFNEHSASNYMNKTTCPSAVFKNYIDAAYPGAPPAATAAVDYKLSVEGVDGANVAAPQILGWIDEQKVALRWKLRFNTSDGGTSLEDTFDIVLTWTGGASKPTMACAPAPVIAAPATVLTADPVIKLRKKAVLFAGRTRQAIRIAGNIAP
jgi:hypothetical protein